jgi:hypothetical protein
MAAGRISTSILTAIRSTATAARSAATSSASSSGLKALASVGLFSDWLTNLGAQSQQDRDLGSGGRRQEEWQRSETPLNSPVWQRRWSSTKTNCTGIHLPAPTSHDVVSTRPRWNSAE